MSEEILPLPISSNRLVRFEDLGKKDYKESWDYQESLFQRIVDRKLQKRLHPKSEENTENHLLFVEHPHVYTLGKSGDQKHLLLNEEQLKKVNATFYPINRGGDITYHGPGQIVGYPIFDLELFFTDIHLYLRFLEEAIIRTLAEFNITAGRIEGLTGVWLDEAHPIKARKIAALGVKCSRWVTLHGFAFNVHPDMQYFTNIIPCGISDKPVTSMEKELGYAPNLEEVKTKLKGHIQHLFGITFQS
ncbi:MAG: lipoyl(octanoyl) transferase LipB [Bacteroidetes bacterium]|nr:lipoyl(octanoyl) transferase LipB [Bacteroidota bacterium]